MFKWFPKRPKKALTVKKTMFAHAFIFDCSRCMAENHLFPYILILSPLCSLFPLHIFHCLSLALIELPSSSLDGSHKFAQGN